MMYICNMYVYIYIYVCMSVSMGVFTRVRVHVCVCAYVCTHAICSLACQGHAASSLTAATIAYVST